MFHNMKQFYPNCLRKYELALSMRLARFDVPIDWILSLFQNGLLIAIIWFPIVYVFNTAITLDRILTIALLYFLLPKPVQAKYPEPLIGPETRKIVVVASMLIGYILLIDFAYNEPLQGVKDAVKRMAVVFVLPIMEVLGFPHRRKLDTILLLSLVPLGMGLVQIFNPNFTLNNLWPPIPRVQVAWPTHLTELIQRTGRIVGTDNTSIGSGMLFGIVTIIGFFKWIEKHSKIGALWFAGTSVLTLFTGTRSAIFGVHLSLFCVYWANDRRFRSAAVLPLVVLAIAGVLYFFVLPAFGLADTRMVDWYDTSTIGKLYSNYLTARYVLVKSPLIGIPKGDVHRVIQSEFTEHYRGTFLTIRGVLTDHNQIGWMLRYYGLIGLGLFTYLCLLFVKKIKSKSSKYHRLVLMGVFVYILQYSVLHSTFFFAYPLFWWMLAIDEPSGDSVKKGRRL